jgi:hypothetical protein
MGTLIMADHAVRLKHRAAASCNVGAIAVELGNNYRPGTLDGAVTFNTGLRTAHALKTVVVLVASAAVGFCGTTVA